ncbi:MAG: Tfp pilus assembly protein PilW [candidate division NC10 bacterium CSP1-5]|nr:MAG: Tfp pilus assembly protein PilW [candidate division NC10 bacterium CSP1-5]
MRRRHPQRRTEAVDGHSTPGRFAADLRGFTLIEILIALSTFLIVLFAVYTSFESSQATYAAGEQRADIQQSARIAMEMMSADLRLAGYGFPTGAGAITVANPTAISFWADLNNASTVIVADVGAGNITLSVQSAAGIQAGNIIHLINGTVSEQRTVAAVNTGVNPHTITLTAATTNAYPWGSQVGRPRLVRYCWHDNPNLDGFAPPAACGALVANTIYKDEGDGGGLQPVANIQNFQVGAANFLTQMQYFDANNNATATPANIRRITITVGMQSPPGAWRQQAFTMISDIRARNL